MCFEVAGERIAVETRERRDVPFDGKIQVRPRFVVVLALRSRTGAQLARQTCNGEERGGTPRCNANVDQERTIGRLLTVVTDDDAHILRKEKVSEGEVPVHDLQETNRTFR